MRTLNETTMIRINDVKALLRKRWYNNKPGERRFFLRDTSGGSSSGYSYNLVIQEYRKHDYFREDGKLAISDYSWDDVEIVASSHDTSMPTVINKIGGIGAYGPTFDRAEIMAVLS